MKEMEYLDSPTGYVTLYNYKEPFMPYVGGYGYQGVLLFNGEDDKVQCHLCGDWFAYLSHHLHREHSMSAAQYKTEVGLSQTTALLGEKQRAVLIKNGLDKRLKNLRINRHHSEASRKKISETLKNLTREKQNKFGTCPEQLLQRIKDKFLELGRTPTQKEITGYQTIVKVWGTWKRAIEIAGIPYRQPTVPINGYKYRYNIEDVHAFIVNWYDEHNSLPKATNWRKNAGAYTVIKKAGGWKSVCRVALATGSKYRKVIGLRYTKDELLNFLSEFQKQNGRPPAVSDCKRGLLPHASRYIYYWKSWRNALKAAGI